MPGTGQAVNQDWLPLGLGLGPPSTGMGYAEANAACLRGFRKVGSRSQDTLFVWKSTGKGLQVGAVEWVQELGGSSSRDHQGRQHSGSHIGEDLHVALTCPLYWGRAQQRNSGFCQCFCLGASCPFCSLLDASNSFPPYMSLVLFELLPLCWS